MMFRDSSNVPTEGHSEGRQRLETVGLVLISMLVLARLFSGEPIFVGIDAPAQIPSMVGDVEPDNLVIVEPPVVTAIETPDAEVPGDGPSARASRPGDTGPIALPMVSRDALFADLRGPLNLNEWSPSTNLNDFPGTHYGGPWLRENIVRLGGHLGLMIHAGRDGARPTMAELKTRKRYGYGRYEVIMKPSGEPGTVSAFFTYTGPWSGNPHDEVDIEFTGQRPRQIEFNYFKNGRTGAHDRINLGFDASERLNLYAFEWREDEIVWFVNGIERYRTPAGRKDIPTQPGQLFISAWTGTKKMEVWTGTPDFGESAQAEYACLSFAPLGDESYSCTDLWNEDPQFETG